MSNRHSTRIPIDALCGSLVIVPVDAGVVVGVADEWDEASDTFGVSWGDCKTRISYEQFNRNFATRERLSPAAGQVVGRFFPSRVEAREALKPFRKH
jgi:hypothetical protein